MTELLNSDFLEHAADLISQADALIVTAGAGGVTRHLHSATVQPGIEPPRFTSLSVARKS